MSKWAWETASAWSPLGGFASIWSWRTGHYLGIVWLQPVKKQTNKKHSHASQEMLKCFSLFLTHKAKTLTILRISLFFIYSSLFRPQSPVLEGLMRCRMDGFEAGSMVGLLVPLVVLDMYSAK